MTMMNQESGTTEEQKPTNKINFVEMWYLNISHEFSKILFYFPISQVNILPTKLLHIILLLYVLLKNHITNEN